MHKNIAVIGYGCTDIAIYMSLMLNRIDIKTAILDVTANKDLTENELISLYLPCEFKNRNGAGYPDIINTKGVAIATDEKSIPADADCVIRFYGNACLCADIADADAIILVTDMYSNHAISLSRVTLPARDESNPVPVITLLQNMISTKYGKRYLLSCIDKKVDKVYTHKFNTTDYGTRLNIGHELINLKSLTPEYRNTLISILEDVLGEKLTGKQTKNVLKTKEKDGGLAWVK